MNQTSSNAVLRCRWPRFSIRSLLLAMVLAAGALAWKCNQVRTQGRVVEAVKNAGGSIWFDYMIGPLGYDVRKPPPSPQFLRRMFGESFLATAVAVDVEASNVIIANVAELGCLTELRLTGDISDEHVVILSKRLPLEVVDLTSENLTDRCLDSLRECKNLEKLVIRKSILSQEALSRLHNELPRCDVACFTQGHWIQFKGVREPTRRDRENERSSREY